VAAGLGVSLLPLTRTPGVQVAPPTPHVRVADRGCSRTIALAWRARRDLVPVAAAFRDFVRDAGPQIATGPAGSAPAPTA
jgi:DNA-binding transcriptional LysR family regulator